MKGAIKWLLKAASHCMTHKHLYAKPLPTHSEFCVHQRTARITLTCSSLVRNQPQPQPSASPTRVTVQEKLTDPVENATKEAASPKKATSRYYHTRSGLAVKPP